jgi:hypothetical protein
MLKLTKNIKKSLQKTANTAKNGSLSGVEMSRHSERSVESIS